jgi:hypothetical protein
MLKLLQARAHFLILIRSSTSNFKVVTSPKMYSDLMVGEMGDENHLKMQEIDVLTSPAP